MKKLHLLVKKVNKNIAFLMTAMLGTMWCLYAFVIFEMLPLAIPSWMNIILYISNCMQLVFMPALMVAGNVLNKKSEARAAQDHKMLLEELLILRHIVKKLEITHAS